MTDEKNVNNPTNTSGSTGGAATPPPAEGTKVTETTKTTTVGKRQLPQMDYDVAKVRTLIAKGFWAVCVFFALVLAGEVLLIAIEANEQNDLVMFMRETADKVDLGLFDLSSPIKDFNEKVPNFSDTGTALFNYGLAAIAWLVIGKIGDAVIRP